MFKKAFTLAEVLIALIIIGFIAVALIRTLDPRRYEEKTNLASSRKTIESVSSGMIQMLNAEKTQCPTKSFMVKPDGATDYEFTMLNSSGGAADATAVVELLGNYMKYESGVLKFCDNTNYCSNDNIKGARLAGGVYFGIEKFSAISDCPSFMIPGESGTTAAPSVFSPIDGTQVTKKCWGKLYFDVSGKKGADTLGQDVYVFGLGEFGVER